jgi:hypothetical protein
MTPTSPDEEHRRRPWSPPALNRLPAESTDIGGGINSDGGDTASAPG